MTLGSRARRVASGWSILMIVAMSGCHAMPLSRLEDNGPNRPQSLASAGRATLLSATVAMDPPSEMSSIEPVLTSPANLTSAAATANAPTPLLDAALQKARGLDEPPVPEPTPSTTPVEPTTPPPSALFTSPTPIEFPVPNPRPAAPIAATVSEPTPAAEPRPAEPAKPEELWRDGIRKLNSLARAKLEQAGGAPSPWVLRSKILACLAEPDIDPEIDPHDAGAVRAVLKALEEPAGDTGRKGETVRSAVLVLEDKAPLEIVDLKLCSRVENYGDFIAFDPPIRKAGQQYLLYCEIDGLRFEQTAAGFRTRVASEIQIVPEGGGPTVVATKLGVAEETCRKRRRDYFIAYKLVLPNPMAPGDYRIRLTARDLATDRTSTREISLAIVKD